MKSHREGRGAKARPLPSSAAPRTIWKGAISFGLVNIPVALRAASRTHDLDFDWLDKRDMASVGYQRINKRTGKPIENQNIVTGYQYAKGQYVLLGDEDFRAANPQASQTVDILGFVDAGEIGPEYFETPYYLEALRRGERAYALLRQAMREANRAGLATMVIHRKQHLAAMLVRGPWLMLVTMRFADEVLQPEDMDEVEDAPKKRGAGGREFEMAERLVAEMTQAWNPGQYHDTYRDDLRKRIDSRIASGRTHELAAAPEESPREGAQVLDLMAALKKSLARKGDGGAPKAKPATAKPRANAVPKSAKAPVRRVAKSTGTAKKRA